MKGFVLMCRTLGDLKVEPRTIAELSDEIGIGYISMLRLIAEFRRAGIVNKVGHRLAPRRRGTNAALYGFAGGEVREVGRTLTRRFLALWNALLDADSADAIAADLGLQENHVRKTIHEMRRAKLARVASWQRSDRAGLPMALYALGDKRDAPRPRALSEQEYNRRANEKRRAKRLHDALSWRAAA